MVGVNVDRRDPHAQIVRHLPDDPRRQGRVHVGEAADFRRAVRVFPAQDAGDVCVQRQHRVGDRRLQERLVIFGH
jgi:hypothetical protein